MRCKQLENCNILRLLIPSRVTGVIWTNYHKLDKTYETYSAFKKSIKIVPQKRQIVWKNIVSFWRYFKFIWRWTFCLIFTFFRLIFLIRWHINKDFKGLLDYCISIWIRAIVSNFSSLNFQPLFWKHYNLSLVSNILESSQEKDIPISIALRFHLLKCQSSQ